MHELHYVLRHSAITEQILFERLSAVANHPLKDRNLVPGEEDDELHKG